MNESEAREFMCEIGRRGYQRQFAAANDGNISYRLSENEVLATPTMVSKGAMRPHEIVKLDLEGKQVGGYMTPTSETLLHLGIYRNRPDVRAVVHFHPPHATAFAVTGVPLDKCVLPEVEIFLGEVPIAAYATPGTEDLFESIRPYVADHSVFLQGNHGVVAIGKNLEEAYWRMEIVEAYCRMLILARQLGNVNKITLENMEGLFDIKRRLGIPDPRMGNAGRDPCAVTPPPSAQSGDEDLIRRVVGEVLKRFDQR